MKYLCKSIENELICCMIYKNKGNEYRKKTEKVNALISIYFLLLFYFILYEYTLERISDCFNHILSLCFL